MIKESRNIAAAVAALTLSVAAFAHNDSAMAAEHVEAANCVAGASKSPATGKASATDNASATGCAGVASTSSAAGCASGASTSSATGNGSAANNTAAAKDLTTGRDLYKEFQNPPKSARPRVWWHWMNGNITKDGIKKDLLWMQKTGIVGFHNFDAGLETPQIVDKRLIYMTPEWKEAFKYAINLADSLDMEMTIASSPGWSETGATETFVESAPLSLGRLKRKYFLYWLTGLDRISPLSVRNVIFCPDMQKIYRQPLKNSTKKNLSS